MSDTQTTPPTPVYMDARKFCGVPPTVARRAVKVSRNAGPKKIVSTVGRPGQPKPMDGVLHGSDDAIYIKLIMTEHGNERHTLEEWQAILNEWRNKPAHPHGVAAAARDAELAKADSEAQQAETAKPPIAADPVPDADQHPVEG